MVDPAPAEALGTSLAGVSERRLLVALALVQFVNVLDFMMVMPLGPDFVQALGIPSSRLGLVAGSYTASAAVSGLVGMLFLDRFDRRKALVVSLAGLALGTLAGGLATGLGSLMFARVLAGAFGGPATALGLAIIADVIPPARRGQALGAVMGAFSVASVFGVPAGLELARLGGWRVPFFAVGALCGAVAAGTALSLPSLTLHLRAAEKLPPAGALDVIRRPVVLIAMAASWVTMLSVFMIVPNITSYLQFNLGYPRARLGMLYLVGGVLSFFTMRVAGRVADRFGTSAVVTFGTLLFIVATVTGFVFQHALLPIIVVFALFMISGSFRMVPMNALATRVPRATERARYMSIQSTVQHVGAAMGAAGSTYLLVEQPGGRLSGMRNVALGSVALALLLPLLIGAVERRVRAAAG
ncbi:MAG: MFS transporter [Polyangiaceae bacterium]|nr:MFS transporter [Polyangiaceae bacterium]